MIRILDESGCGGEGRCLADAAGWEWKRAVLLTLRVVTEQAAVVRILGGSGYRVSLADAAGYESKRAALPTGWVGRGGWAQAMISWMGRTCSTPTSF